MPENETARNANRPGVHFADLLGGGQRERRPPSRERRQPGFLGEIGIDFEPDDDSEVGAPTRLDILAVAVPSETVERPPAGEDVRYSQSTRVVPARDAQEPGENGDGEVAASPGAEVESTRLLAGQEVAPSTEPRAPAGIESTRILPSGALQGAAPTWIDEPTIVDRPAFASVPDREASEGESGTAQTILQDGLAGGEAPTTVFDSSGSAREVDDLFEGKPAESAELSLDPALGGMPGGEYADAELDLPVDIGFGVGDVLPEAPEGSKDADLFAEARLQQEEGLEDILAATTSADGQSAYDEEMILDGGWGDPPPAGPLWGDGAARGYPGGHARPEASASTGSRLEDDADWGAAALQGKYRDASANDAVGAFGNDIPADAGLESVLTGPGAAAPADAAWGGDSSAPGGVPDAVWGGPTGLPDMPADRGGGDAPLLGAVEMESVLGAAPAAAADTDHEATLEDLAPSDLLDFDARGRLPDGRPAHVPVDAAQGLAPDAELDNLLAGSGGAGAVPSTNGPQDQALSAGMAGNVLPDSADAILAAQAGGDALFDGEPPATDDHGADLLPGMELPVGDARPEALFSDAQPQAKAGSAPALPLPDSPDLPPASGLDDFLGSAGLPGSDGSEADLAGAGQLDHLIADLSDRPAHSRGRSQESSGVSGTAMTQALVGAVMQSGRSAYALISQAMDLRKNWGLYCDLAAALISVISLAVIVASLVWY